MEHAAKLGRPEHGWLEHEVWFDLCNQGSLQEGNLVIRLALMGWKNSSPAGAGASPHLSKDGHAASTDPGLALSAPFPDGS